MKLKAVAWLIGIIMVIVPFSSSCNVGSDMDMDIDIKIMVSALDDNRSTSFETATFSMG